jgi:hypothetical protein
MNILADGTASSLPLVISIVALVLSVLTFWKNYLSPFKPEVLIGPGEFRLTQIADTTCIGAPNENAGAWVIALDMPVTIANSGAKPGRIMDMRLILEQGDGKREWFAPIWRIDRAKFMQSELAYEDRIEASKLGMWCPQLLLSKAIVNEHIVFQSHAFWSEASLTDTVNFCVYFEIDYGRGLKCIEAFPFELPIEIMPQMKKGASILFAKAASST